MKKTKLIDFSNIKPISINSDDIVEVPPTPADQKRLDELAKMIKEVEKNEEQED